MIFVWIRMCFFSWSGYVFFCIRIRCFGPGYFFLIRIRFFSASRYFVLDPDIFFLIRIRFFFCIQMLCFGPGFLFLIQISSYLAHGNSLLPERNSGTAFWGHHKFYKEPYIRDLVRTSNNYSYFSNAITFFPFFFKKMFTYVRSKNFPRFRKKMSKKYKKKKISNKT